MPAGATLGNVDKNSLGRCACAAVMATSWAVFFRGGLNTYEGKRIIDRDPLATWLQK